MKKLLSISLFLFCSCSLAQGTTGATQKSDGAVKVGNDDKHLAWDGVKFQWVSLEQFWLNFADRTGGLTWGRSSDYPNYNDVNEFDTFLVETSKGPCLMQFFHSRWRRANDVQRWDDHFNDYAGCPDVFD